MSGFHNIIFPIKMARGAIGGPMRHAEIFTRANGIESRNISLLNSRRRWNIASSGAKLDDLHEIIAFFEARMGQAYAFRFKDPIDNLSCLPSQSPSMVDQEIGIGDGAQSIFQLCKNYGDAQNNYRRAIKLPIIGTILISINNQLQNAQNYAINYLTGQIIFNIAPANGAIIKAGFAFDTPVRFENEALELSLESPQTGRINDIQLLEVLL